MKKQQIVLVIGGALLLCLIYFFGRTVPPQKKSDPTMASTGSAASVDIGSILAASREQLTTTQQAYVSQLEAAVVRGDVKAQQIKVFHQLAAFWKDSAHMLLPYAWYSGEAAKLENSQKSLTFAAQFFLEGVRRQDNPELKKWMGTQAKELFEKALQLNPGNDSLKIGLGSCYLFGNISDMPMQGIQIIREVADRDPNNMYAQFMLGMGAMVSGQLDKAIERLTKVAEHEPGNLEATLVLAEAYERKGEKANAVKWYQVSRKNIQDTAIVKEIEHRISLLKK
jgi:tetratricopeptide (TPR) repeat protein